MENNTDQEEEKLLSELLNDTQDEGKKPEEVFEEVKQEVEETPQEEPKQVETVITPEPVKPADDPHPDGWKYLKGCECTKCKEHRDYQKKYQADRRRKDNGVKTEPEPAKPTPQAEETAEQKLERELKGFSEEADKNKVIAPGAKVDPKPVNISEFVSGTMLLMALDYTFPLFVKFGVGFFAAKYKKINAAGCEALQLTPAEHKKLEPMADELVKILFATIPPAWAFVFFWGTTTFYKVMMLDPDKHFDK